MKLRFFLFLFFPLFLAHALIWRAGTFRSKNFVLGLVSGRNRVPFELQQKRTINFISKYGTVDSVSKSFIKSLGALDSVDRSKITKELVSWFNNNLARAVLSEIGLNSVHSQAYQEHNRGLSYENWPSAGADAAFRLARASVQGSSELASRISSVLGEFENLPPCQICQVMRKINFDWVYRNERYPVICDDFDAFKCRIVKPLIMGDQGPLQTNTPEGSIHFSPLFALSGAKYQEALESMSLSHVERAKANKRFLAEILEDAAVTGASLFADFDSVSWHASVSHRVIFMLACRRLTAEAILGWEGLKQTDSSELIKKLCASGFKGTGVIPEVCNSLKALELMIKLPEARDSIRASLVVAPPAWRDTGLPFELMVIRPPPAGAKISAEL